MTPDNKDASAMHDNDTTAPPVIQAPGAVKRGKAKTKPAGSDQTHLWLGPESQRALNEAAEAIARITGTRESWAVLLRASITTLTDEIKLVEAEHKRSKEIGRREWRLRHAIARACFASR